MALSVTSIQMAGLRSARLAMPIMTSTIAYTTGGLSLTPAQIGLSRVSASYVIAAPLAGGSVYIAQYNPTTSRVLLYWVDTTTDGATLPEVPNTTVLGTVVYSGFFFGV